VLSLRAKFLTTALVAASLLAGCSQSGTTTTPPTTITIQQIQNDIKTACGYVPTVESIVAVAGTITTAVNPAAGATATVLAATGNAVVNAICQAVQTQTASLRTRAKASPNDVKPAEVTVTVNGVPVTGLWSPPPPENKT
jgi:hypothetical protein